MIISPLLFCEFIKDLCTLLAPHNWRTFHSLSRFLCHFLTPFIYFIFHSLNGWNPLIKSLPLSLSSAHNSQLSENIIKCKRQRRWCTRATHSLFGCTQFHLAILFARIVATSLRSSVFFLLSPFFTLFSYFDAVVVIVAAAVAAAVVDAIFPAISPWSFINTFEVLIRLFRNLKIKLARSGARTSRHPPPHTNANVHCTIAAAFWWLDDV